MPHRLSKKAILISKWHKSGDGGEPLARVPHDKTIHRIVLSPLLSLRSPAFRSLRGATKGAAFGIRRLWKKAGENFFVCFYDFFFYHLFSTS